MNKLQAFRALWAGRKYKCIDTGAILVIPNNVNECDFFMFGNCYVDVGRHNFYSRFGGNIQIIDAEENVNAECNQ